MAIPVLPLWAELTVAFLVLLGAAVALVGSLGLLRLPSYFERVHAPAVIATLGLWCIMHASIIFFSVVGHRLAWHPWLIALFIAITVPVTNIFLMRAALFRARRAGQDVPPNLSLSDKPRSGSEHPLSPTPTPTPTPTRTAPVNDAPVMHQD